MSALVDLPRKKKLLVIAAFALIFALIFSFSSQATPQPAFSQDNAAVLEYFDASDPLVRREGAWNGRGDYLMSSGRGQFDALTFSFEGTRVDVFYLQHPKTGALAIEVDDVVVRTVETRGKTVEVKSAVVDYLAEGVHVLRVYPVSGAVAVEGFYTSPILPDRLPTSLAAKVGQQGSVRVIVEFVPGYSANPEMLATMRANVARGFANVDRNARFVANSERWSVPLAAFEVNTTGLAYLAKNPMIASVQEDALNFPTLGSSTGVIDAPEAWALGYDGSGQTVAIIDTGVQNNHSFLSGRVVAEACYSTNSGRNIKSLCPNGQTSQTGTGAASPLATQCISGSTNLCTHGTHVAGISSGNGTSFDGVAPASTVIAVQVFTRFNSRWSCYPYSAPCISAYSSNIISGLNYVYSLRNTYNIASVNMSLGGGKYTSHCDTDSRKPIIDSLRASGIATVIASGNSSYKDGIGAPACISTAISVGATNNSDVVASWSNSDDTLDLLAPGVSINSSIPNNTFAVYSGTSMATPHVAGAWAVLKEAKPSASVTEILAALQATGVPVTDTNGITTRRIDLDNAITDLLTP